MKKALAFIFSLFLLTACSTYKDIPVDVSPERRAELEKIIQESQVAIDNYQGPENTLPHLDIINQAEAYHELGQVGKAIQIYQKTIDEDQKSIAIMNNLARLYEKVGEYEKAIALYNDLMTSFGETQYLYNITWAYIWMEDRENALKHYNFWRQAFNNKTDVQTQQAINDLKKDKRS